MNFPQNFVTMRKVQELKGDERVRLTASWWRQVQSGCRRNSQRPRCGKEEAASASLSSVNENGCSMIKLAKISEEKRITSQAQLI